MRMMILALAMALFATSSAVAQFQAGDGAQGSGGSGGGTVMYAKSARDDSMVTLTGNIVARLSDDDFTFRDSTGEIRVEIDDEVWRGQKVKPDTMVRISGEVDRDLMKTKVDVHTLEIVK
jgi:uncharacterized protein (TIGR00156 family)